MSQNAANSKGKPPRRRIRSGGRAFLACVNCKEKKMKCDNHAPSCENCSRSSSNCLIEDPFTKKQRPRDYIEILERRVAFLEDALRQYRPDLAADHLAVDGLSQSSFQPDSESTSKPIDLNRQNGRPEEVEDLASKVGLLNLNAAGAEPIYLGSSSIFAFSRLINSSLRQIVTGSSRGTKDDNPLISPSPCLLPDYSSAVQLSNAYFRNVHIQYPFLHEPTFRTWERSLLCESIEFDSNVFGPVPLFFLNMVYAVGALLLPSCGYSPEKLYASAQVYVDHILPFDNLEAIQAILSCAIYSLRAPRGPSHWKLAGMALRQCIDLGYHRNAKCLKSTADPLRRELCKWSFWCAYTLETQAAVMLGRPQGIPYFEVDAEYPTDINESCITKTGIYGIPRESKNDALTNMTRAIHTFRIRRLLSRIHSTLYSNGETFCSRTNSRQTAIQQLREEVENWYLEIPPTPAAKEPLTLFPTSDWFDLEYNYAIIQLYRSEIIHGPTGAGDDVFIQCMRASESICHGYRRQFVGKPTSSTWTALHELFLGGLTYLHCLWTSPAAREAHANGQVSSTCSDCTIALVIMAERWHAAAPYRDIFETLSNLTMKMMEEANGGISNFTLATTLHGRLVENDLMEQMELMGDSGISDGISELLDRLLGENPRED